MPDSLREQLLRGEQERRDDLTGLAAKLAEELGEDG